MSNIDQKREAMLALVEEWRQSGETQAHFAAKQQISFAKFQYWVRKSKAAATPEGFGSMLYQGTIKANKFNFKGV